MSTPKRGRPPADTRGITIRLPSSVEQELRAQADVLYRQTGKLPSLPRMILIVLESALAK